MPARPPVVEVIARVGPIRTVTTMSSVAAVITDTCAVQCDDAGNVGTLSYQVPAHQAVHVGDAVRVPFGPRERTGVVVGPGDPGKATKPILAVYGRRTNAETVELARLIAASQYVPFSSMAKRLAPRARRGNPPLDAGPVLLSTATDTLRFPVGVDALIRRYYTTAPGIDKARVAALEAVRMARHGQVLVLCPTKAFIRQVVSWFRSGAGRLDEVPKRDEPSAWRGFAEGTVRIGVGSRAAALWAARDLAGIVVVDEAHPGHVEETQPYTSARDVAAARTAAAGIPFTLIGDVPSPMALASGVRMLPVGTDDDWPHIEIAERFDSHSVPSGLLHVARQAQATKRKVIVCSVSDRERRWCARCGREVPTAERCERCGSTVFRVSAATSRPIRRLFPQAAVLSPAAALMHGPSPDAVVLIDLDTFTRLPDLYPQLTAARLLAASSRIAGSGGRLVVITSTPDDPLPTAFATHNLRLWSVWLWQTAEVLGLPPFRRMVTVRMRRRSRPPVPTIDGVRWLGPTPRGDGEWEIVAIAERVGPELGDFIERTRRRGKARVTIT